MRVKKVVVGDLVPINPIRVETVLPRFPIHRLSKHGDVTIDIKEQNSDGEILIRWEISHNSKYGQPGPLAYKLDTLIINRRIEEAARPIPKIVRLGSFREISEELGISTHNTTKLKNALYQNASAFITAKTRYRQTNGKERVVEIGDTRYGVVFTGEKLPDGRIADAVYIVLHDFFREILDSAITRPLDYDYLRDLAPAAQRFYELLSYHIYAALKHERPRAKLVYSEFCTYAPQTRYFEFEKVKKQMHKLHCVHRKSGYIALVNFEQTTDSAGQPDWIMLYQPGHKAHSEFQAFAKRADGALAQTGQTTPGQEVLAPSVQQLDLKLTPPRKSCGKAKPEPLSLPLVADLLRHGITSERAVQLAEQHPDRITLQVEYLEWEMTRKPDKIADPAAYLVKAIERANMAPKGFVSAAERQRREEARQAKEQSAAKAHRDQREQEAADKAKDKRDATYWASLTADEQAELQSRIDARVDPSQLASETGPLRKLGQTIRRRDYLRELLDGLETDKTQA